MLKFFLTTHLVCVFYIHDGNIWLLKKKSKITNSRNEMNNNNNKNSTSQFDVCDQRRLLFESEFSRSFFHFFSRSSVKHCTKNLVIFHHRTHIPNGRIESIGKRQFNGIEIICVLKINRSMIISHHNHHHYYYLRA